MLVVLENVHCIICVKSAGATLAINQIFGIVPGITMITCKKRKDLEKGY